jgi:hypothetical protein
MHKKYEHSSIAWHFKRAVKATGYKFKFVYLLVGCQKMLKKQLNHYQFFRKIL